MRPINQYINNTWNCFAFIFLSNLISMVGQKIYAIWFYMNKILVEIIQQHISPAIAAMFEMLIFEGHAMLQAIWYTLKKYRRDPRVYGLNRWTKENCCHRPVLLLHGAVGTWSYLGDLGDTLKNANIPVFVINLGSGLPAEEIRTKILDKIEEIIKLYYDFNQKLLKNESNLNQIDRQSVWTAKESSSTTELLKINLEDGSARTILNAIPLVDIVAHSNGGKLALYSTFTQECSHIDAGGNLKFRVTPQANLHVGKVITIAMPSNETETDWMRQINKLDDLFNVNAKFDALMAYKKCALIEELPSHVEYIDATHIGIVFKQSAYQQILQFLLK